MQPHQVVTLVFRPTANGVYVEHGSESVDDDFDFKVQIGDEPHNLFPTHCFRANIVGKNYVDDISHLLIWFYMRNGVGQHHHYVIALQRAHPKVNVGCSGVSQVGPPDHGGIEQQVSVFVDVVEFLEPPQGASGDTVRSTVGLHRLDFFENSIADTDEADCWLCDAIDVTELSFHDGEAGMVWLVPVEEHQLVCEVIEGAAEIVNEVPDESTPVVRKVGRLPVDPIDIPSSLVVHIRSEVIEVAFDERLMFALEGLCVTPRGGKFDFDAIQRCADHESVVLQ